MYYNTSPSATIKSEKKSDGTSLAWGLSICHIEDIHAYSDDSGITFYRKVVPPKGSTPRYTGLTSGMTTHARMRLFKYTERLEFWGYNPTHMITLTLAEWENTEEYVERWRIIKRAFLNDYLSKYQLILGYLWFMEFQKRGAPHLHVLIEMDDEFWEETLKYMIHAWQVSVERTGLLVPFQAVDLHTTKKDFRYTRKYASKMYQKKAPFRARWGRWWGAGGSYAHLPKLPTHDLSALEIEEVIHRLLKSDIKVVASMSQRIYDGRTTRVWIAQTCYNSRTKSN